MRLKGRRAARQEGLESIPARVQLYLLTCIGTKGRHQQEYLRPFRSEASAYMYGVEYSTIYNLRIYDVS